MINRILNLFPIWAVIFCLVALIIPEVFASMKQAIVPLLTIVMFGMGMTLTWENFYEVLKSPKVIFLGVLLQFIVMPLTAYLISLIFGFSSALLAGMLLVGSSPGGTASNVITYLAKGKVALSITLTLTSTILSVAATPAITYLYLQYYIDVPVWSMFLSVLQMVLVPVLLGTLINSYFGKKLEKIQPVFPLISIIAIVWIIAIIVGLNRDKLSDIGMLIIGAVILHNSTGLILGYTITRLFKFDKQTCRTIAIEVGMQNSGLAVALAIKFFSAAAAIPGAVFSIWHNLSGSILAGIWRSSNETKKSPA